MSAVFVVALLAGVLLKFWLASRQIRHVAAFRSSVPDRFAQTVTLQAHQKGADYTIAITGCATGTVGFYLNAGTVADAARRLMAVGSNPDDTIDEPSGDDVATAPRGR